MYINVVFVYSERAKQMQAELVPFALEHGLIFLKRDNDMLIFKRDLKEWDRIKQESPGTVVLVQRGHMFYVYGKDRETLNNITGEVQFHKSALEIHIRKLIESGKTVSIVF